MALARLARVTEIQKLLVDQLRVLETMTPLDFLDFRDLLLPASGFQSLQFRLIERKLGLRPERRAATEKGTGGASLTPGLAKPSVLPRASRRCSRWSSAGSSARRSWNAGIPVLGQLCACGRRHAHPDREAIASNPTLGDDERATQLAELERGTRFSAVLDESAHARLVASGQRRLSWRATQAALFIHLYRDQPILHLPFRFLTTLVDVRGTPAAWRYRHALMVHRMIGTKIGTGGSSGHHYLPGTVERNKVFKDLSALSSFFIPRSALPTLPPDVRSRMGFR